MTEVFGGTALSERDSRLAELAEETRRLMEAIRTTAAAPEGLATAAETVAEARAALETPGGDTGPQDSGRHANPIVHNPVIGTANPYAPPLATWTNGDGTVAGEVTLTQVHEGPPNAVHGGISAMLLDQLLGHAVAAAGNIGMTAELTIRYRRPTPYGVPLRLLAWADGTDGRQTLARATLEAGGRVCVEADGTFLRPRNLPSS